MGSIIMSNNRTHFSNQIFHYIRCNTLKRVTRRRGPFLRHCTRETQILSNKCRSGCESLATLHLTNPRFEPQTSRSRDERVTDRLFFRAFSGLRVLTSNHFSDLDRDWAYVFVPGSGSNLLVGLQLCNTVQLCFFFKNTAVET